MVDIAPHSVQLDIAHTKNYQRPTAFAAFPEGTGRLYASQRIALPPRKPEPPRWRAPPDTDAVPSTISQYSRCSRRATHTCVALLPAAQPPASRIAHSIGAASVREALGPLTAWRAETGRDALFGEAEADCGFPA